MSACRILPLGVRRESWPTRMALLMLCAPYLQGGLSKALDWPAAVAEMHHFGLEPASMFAFGVLLFELLAGVAVVVGWQRRAAALALAGFTLLASLLSSPFWIAPMEQRMPMLIAFCEHLGLMGGLWLASCLPEAMKSAQA